MSRVKIKILTELLRSIINKIDDVSRTTIGDTQWGVDAKRLLRGLQEENKGYKSSGLALPKELLYGIGTLNVVGQAVFIEQDGTLEQRARISAYASIYGKKLGKKFSVVKHAIPIEGTAKFTKGFRISLKEIKNT